MDVCCYLKVLGMASAVDILISIMLPLVAPQQERKAHSLWEISARESEVWGASDVTRRQATQC